MGLIFFTRKINKIQDFLFSTVSKAILNERFQESERSLQNFKNFKSFLEIWIIELEQLMFSNSINFTHNLTELSDSFIKKESISSFFWRFCYRDPLITSIRTLRFSKLFQAIFEQKYYIESINDTIVLVPKNLIIPNYIHVNLLLKKFNISQNELSSSQLEKFHDYFSDFYYLEFSEFIKKKDFFESKAYLFYNIIGFE